MSKQGRNFPQQRQTKVSVAAQSQMVGYVGPIPPPDQLDAFNAIIPDGANRIMIMAEKAQQAQIARSQDILSAKKKSVEYEHLEVILGQTFSFIICMAALGGGFFLLWKGMSWQGIALAAAPIVNIIVALITRGKNNSK